MKAVSYQQSAVRGETCQPMREKSGASWEKNLTKQESAKTGTAQEGVGGYTFPPLALPFHRTGQEIALPGSTTPQTPQGRLSSDALHQMQRSNCEEFSQWNLLRTNVLSALSFTSG